MPCRCPCPVPHAPCPVPRAMQAALESHSAEIEREAQAQPPLPNHPCTPALHPRPAPPESPDLACVARAMACSPYALAPLPPQDPTPQPLYHLVPSRAISRHLVPPRATSPSRVICRISWRVSSSCGGCCGVRAARSWLWRPRTSSSPWDAAPPASRVAMCAGPRPTCALRPCRPCAVQVQCRLQPLPMRRLSLAHVQVCHFSLAHVQVCRFSLAHVQVCHLSLTACRCATSPSPSWARAAATVPRSRPGGRLACCTRGCCWRRRRAATGTSPSSHGACRVWAKQWSTSVRQ